MSGLYRELLAQPRLLFGLDGSISLAPTCFDSTQTRHDRHRPSVAEHPSGLFEESW